MSMLKTGFIAASLCLAASFAHADSSVPVQDTPVLKEVFVSSNARAAFASAPRATRAWTQTKSAPFTRDVTESMSGH